MVKVQQKFDKETFTWKYNPPIITGRNNRTNIITNAPGPAAACRNAKTELDCCSIFFTKEMVEIIVKCTNQKIQKVVENVGEKESMDKYPFFKETSTEEILALIGLMYFHGVLGQSHMGIESLFSPVMGHCVHSAIISRNRYQFLMKCMSSDDGTTRPERWQKDRFAAFREILELFDGQCAASFVPDIYLSLD